MSTVILRAGDFLQILFQDGAEVILEQELSVKFTDERIACTYHKVDVHTGEHRDCRKLWGMKNTHPKAAEAEDLASFVESLRSMFGAENVAMMGFDPKEFRGADGRDGSELTPEERASATPLIARQGGHNQVVNGQMVLETSDAYRLFADPEGTYFIHSVEANENRLVNPREWQTVAHAEAILPEFEIGGALERLWQGAIAAN